MRIVIISDTHQHHNEVSVPDGDILIHCGDFTNKGQDDKIANFLDWFSEQKPTYKAFISGNHELGLDNGVGRDRKINLIKSYTNDKLFYLENSDVTINGLKIYGSPITPWFHDWAWNVHRGPNIAKFWDMIPEDTNILITHGPPYGILDTVEDFFERDQHQGCQDLLNRLEALKSLKLHSFGHLHLEGGNQIKINNTVFANGAMCDDRHNPSRVPVVVDL